jgi:sulfide:quinone oxidoreductase
MTAGLEHATTWNPEGATEIFAGILRDLEEGHSTSVAFVVPDGQVWPLPAYELALMTARDVRAMSLEAQVTVVTHEPEPLAFLGQRAARTLARTLDDAGVALVAGSTATVERAPRVHLRIEPSGDIVEAARVVSMPVLRGRAIEGVPADAEGFIPIDHAGRVQGLERVYAAGDGVASPVKLGGLATHQARVAVREVARRAGLDVPAPSADDKVVLDGVLMTGYAPIALTGDSAQSHGAPVWWPSRKVASHYLERYLGGTTEPAKPPAGVPLRLTSDELFSLGRRMHEYERR